MYWKIKKKFNIKKWKSLWTIVWCSLATNIPYHKKLSTFFDKIQEIWFFCFCLRNGHLSIINFTQNSPHCILRRTFYLGIVCYWNHINWKPEKHTEIARMVRGSNRSFSPGGILWFSICSSWRFSSLSKPSMTVIQFPPRYLIKGLQICKNKSFKLT